MSLHSQEVHFVGGHRHTVTEFSEINVSVFLPFLWAVSVITAGNE